MDLSRRRYGKENFPNILKITEGLKAIGERHSATGGQVSLAWLLAQGEDIIPIPGTKRTKVYSRHFLRFLHVTEENPQYFKENIAAAQVKLTPEEVKEVREVADKANAVNGERGIFLFVDTPPL